MILTGRSLCLPSPATVQELFFVARDANIIPDISLDPVLTTFLSLDSSAALQHQYAFLQRGMSREQQSAFSLNLTGELGGVSRVTYGGVGVVALALSMLFDQVAQQVGKTYSVLCLCMCIISQCKMLKQNCNSELQIFFVIPPSFEHKDQQKGTYLLRDPGLGGFLASAALQESAGLSIATSA